MLHFIGKIKLKHLLFIGVGFLLSVLAYKKCFPCRSEKRELPVLVWWTPFMPQNKRIIDCGQFQCVSTKNRSYGPPAAYLFYGSNVNASDLPLPRSSTPWAIFHEESPKNLAFFLNERGQSLFNLTSTFSRHSDLPVTLQYLKQLNDLTDNKYYVPVKKKNEFLKEISPVLYVQSSCDTPIDRDKFVSELMKYVQVDAYGECLNNKKLPESLHREKSFDVFDDAYLQFEAKYKFVISIENSICEDYITEKLWRPLMIGSVPIYLGSPSVQDWLPNEKSAILIDRYESMEAVAQVIHELNANDTLYNEYLEHQISGMISNTHLKEALSKGFYGVPDCDEDRFIIENFECAVCTAAHSRNFPEPKIQSVFECVTPDVRNTWRTHWTIGRCQAKALDYFINHLKLNNYSQAQYEALSLQYYREGGC